MSWLSDRTGIHINSINDVTSGRAIKEAVKNPLVMTLAGMALPGVGSLIGAIPGVGSAVNAVSSRAKGLLDHIPDGLKDAVSGGGADGKGNFGTLGDMAGKLVSGGSAPGGSGSSLLDKLLLGGTVAANVADQVQKRNLQNKAQDYATSAYDAKAPLRAKALALLANPAGPDPRLAAISADPGNVYDKARRARMLAASMSQTPPIIPSQNGVVRIGGHAIPVDTQAGAA